MAQQRASTALDAERDALEQVVDSDRTVVARDRRGQLGPVDLGGPSRQRRARGGLRDATTRNRVADDLMVPLAGGMMPGQFDMHLALLRSSSLPRAAVTERAVAGLKFSEALPSHLASATLGERMGDPEGARAALSERAEWRS